SQSPSPTPGEAFLVAALTNPPPVGNGKAGGSSLYLDGGSGQVLPAQHQQSVRHNMVAVQCLPSAYLARDARLDPALVVVVVVEGLVQGLPARVDDLGRLDRVPVLAEQHFLAGRGGVPA